MNPFYEARDLLAKHGWTQNKGHDPETDRICVGSAIFAVVVGIEVVKAVEQEYRLRMLPRYQQEAVLLQNFAQDELYEATGWSCIPDWNDDSCEDLSEALNFLQGVGDAWEKLYPTQPIVVPDVIEAELQPV